MKSSVQNVSKGFISHLYVIRMIMCINIWIQSSVHKEKVFANDPT